MKSFLVLLLLSSVGIAADAQQKEAYLTKSLSGETIRNVEVETSGGNIKVTGGAGTDARIEVYITGNGNRMNTELTREEIQKRLDEFYTLDISVAGGKASAKAKPKRNNMDWKRGLSISFNVFVPEAVSTELTTSGGNIQLSRLSGQQHFTTSGGNLQLDNLSGKTKGTTSGGNIHITASKDDVNLSTSGGNIEATDCNGKLTLTTSGGSLRLQGLNGEIDATTSGGNVEGEAIAGELSAQTSGGNIRLENLTCQLDASTSGGHIDVRLNELTKSVRLRNSGGNIRLQLPKGVHADLELQARNVNTDKLDSFSGTIKDDEISGKLNGGGISVRVDAGSGKVSLSFQ